MVNLTKLSYKILCGFEHDDILKLKMGTEVYKLNEDQVLGILN
jgi:hypothetical protein